MKNWEKEFKQKFVKGYGNGLVDWKYPEEGNVIDFIQTILDKQKEDIRERIEKEIAKEFEEIGVDCPEEYGFEGRETFPACGKCIICRLKEKYNK